MIEFARLLLRTQVIYKGYNRDGESMPLISAGVPLPAAVWQRQSGNAFVLYANLSHLGLSAGINHCSLQDSTHVATSLSPWTEHKQNVRSVHTFVLQVGHCQIRGEPSTLVIKQQT